MANVRKVWFADEFRGWAFVELDNPLDEDGIGPTEARVRVSPGTAVQDWRLANPEEAAAIEHVVVRNFLTRLDAFLFMPAIFSMQNEGSI